MARSIFDCIDGHTCGNPVRVVKTGHPPLVGNNHERKASAFYSRIRLDSKRVDV